MEPLPLCGQQRTAGAAAQKPPPGAERELTARQREMLALYYDRGLKMVQIAKKLGVNRSTVSRTIKRAQDKLRRYLRYSL